MVVGGGIIQSNSKLIYLYLVFFTCTQIISHLSKMSSEKEEEIVITLEHKSCTKKKKESRKEKAKEKKKKWLTQQNETAEI